MKNLVVTFLLLTGILEASSSQIFPYSSARNDTLIDSPASPSSHQFQLDDSEDVIDENTPPAINLNYISTPLKSKKRGFMTNGKTAFVDTETRGTGYNRILTEISIFAYEDGKLIETYCKAFKNKRNWLSDFADAIPDIYYLLNDSHMIAHNAAFDRDTIMLAIAEVEKAGRLHANYQPLSFIPVDSIGMVRRDIKRSKGMRVISPEKTGAFEASLTTKIKRKLNFDKKQELKNYRNDLVETVKMYMGLGFKDKKILWHINSKKDKKDATRIINHLRRKNLKNKIIKLYEESELSYNQFINQIEDISNDTISSHDALKALKHFVSKKPKVDLSTAAGYYSIENTGEAAELLGTDYEYFCEENAPEGSQNKAHEAHDDTMKLAGIGYQMLTKASSNPPEKDPFQFSPPAINPPAFSLPAANPFLI